jgi:CBS-domain-containing membrane protein
MLLHGEYLDYVVMRPGARLAPTAINDVRRIPRERWGQTNVREAMTPAREVHTLRPDDAAFEALRELAEHDALPVVDQDRLVGVARRADILKWLSLHTSRA